GNSGHDPHTADPAGDAAPTDFAAAAPETWQQLESDWWSESVDGRCSESAALFAASQPAPLSVV
ncbi:MAG: hypothetical protein ABI434_17045, partial [Burkholderiaceae bacterium]